MQLNKPINMELSASFTTKQVGEGEDAPLRIRGYANTTNKDRACDVIPREAWENASAMSNYLKNPIILAFHDHDRPIGKMVDYMITEKGLQIEAEISKAAGAVYDLIKEGILRTFSIGFRVLDADYNSETGIFVIKELELYETSVVSVPCNQDSTFEVSKSLNAHDYNLLKQQVIEEDAGLEQDDVLTKLAKMLDII